MMLKMFNVVSSGPLFLAETVNAVKQHNESEIVFFMVIFLGCLMLKCFMDFIHKKKT